MPHNFIEGIDIIGDPTGDTPLGSLHRFNSAGGNDVNVGDNPNLPKQTNAFIGALGGLRYVLGSDQVYDVNGINTGVLIGDGQIVIDGNGVNYLGSGSGSFSIYNAIIRGFINLNWTSAPFATLFVNLINCVLDGNIQTGTISPTTTGEWDGTFMNHDARISVSNNSNSVIRRCVFYNSDVEILFAGANGSFHSNIFKDDKVIATLANAERVEYCYFDNCTFEIDAVLYPDMSAVKTAHPTAFPNDVSGDAQHIGSYDRLEYKCVGSGSVLLGAGKLGVNIGGVNIGAIFNSTSTVDTFTNAQFNGEIMEQINALSTGTIEFAEVELPRVTLDPVIDVLGISDFINNVVRVDQGASQPDLPNKRTIKIQTADIDKVYRVERIYREGYRISEDGNGLASGIDEYHEYAPNRERVKWVKVKVELNT